MCISAQPWRLVSTALDERAMEGSHWILPRAVSWDEEVKRHVGGHVERENCDNPNAVTKDLTRLVM